MNGISELAKMLKERENKQGYSPVFGTIIDLPVLKVHLGGKVILTEEHIVRCVSIDGRDEDGEYVNLGKEAVLLPFADNQKFILIGIINN